MLESRLVYILACALIGVSLACLHIFHVSNALEAQKGFSYLSKQQRELYLTQDQGLYYFYFKTIVEARSLEHGINQIVFDNGSEFPTSVNAMHRFNTVPEIFCGFLYLSFLNMTDYYGISTLICEAEAGEVRCDGLGDPIYFYLSCIWILSGLTVFTMFMSGIYLARHMLGGFAAVIYYFALHEHATSILSAPSARENFAFPFILIQIFIFTKEIGKRGYEETQLERKNYTFVSDLSLITTISLLFWRVASLIFSLQILVVFLMLETRLLTKSLALDYALSQMLSNTFAFFLMNKNAFFLTSVHFALAIALFVHLTKIHSVQEGGRVLQFIRTLPLFLFLFYFIADLLNKLFSEFQPNVTASFVDLALMRLGRRAPNIVSHLFDSSPLYYYVGQDVMKAFFNVLCLKNLCLFIVVYLGGALQRYRERANEEDRAEAEERAKNYVIEDFMEENKVKMNDLSDPKTEQEIDRCLALLKKCKYDYARYKKAKESLLLETESEKISFLSDIKRLKNQINEKERKKGQNSDEPPPTDDDKAENDDDGDDVKEKQEEETATEKELPAEEPEKPQIDRVMVFSICQASALLLATVFVAKLKFVAVPVSCLVAATLPSRGWFSRHAHIYWPIYVVLMLCTLINPGVKNLLAQYQPAALRHGAELERLLFWVDKTTDRGAVFAGSIEAIAAIRLVTGRPIVNHPHLEVPEMLERTHVVYSVYGRQSSLDVHNAIAALKADYLVLAADECSEMSSTGHSMAAFWDRQEPEHRLGLQICAEIFSQSFTSFLKVYEGRHFVVVRVFADGIYSDFDDVKLLPARYKSTTTI